MACLKCVITTVNKLSTDVRMSYDPYNTLVSTSQRKQSVSINKNWLMQFIFLIIRNTKTQWGKTLCFLVLQRLVQTDVRMP